MNARFVRGLAATYALILLAAPAPEAPRLVVPGKQLPVAVPPTKLTLWIGGGIFPPNYFVTLDGKDVIYRVKSYDETTKKETETTQSITPSAEQWDEFWKAMGEVDIWRWKPVYEDPRMADGTHWSVEVSHDGRSVRSRGRILVPGQETVESRPDFGPLFEKYLAAVKKLIGGLPFR